jgi:hypothetical protein
MSFSQLLEEPLRQRSGRQEGAIADGVRSRGAHSRPAPERGTAAHWKLGNKLDVLERHLLTSKGAARPAGIAAASAAAADAFIRIHAAPPALEWTRP